MGKNQNPNKGFFKELASKPKSENKKESFTYSSPVTPQSSSTTAMNTPRRLSQFKAVSSAKSNLTQEHRTHTDTRRGKR